MTQVENLPAMRLATLPFVLLCALFGAAACSPLQQLERGQTEQAFHQAATRLERGGRSSAKLVEALGVAYARLQADDLADLDALARATPATDPYGERRVVVLAALDGRRRRMEALRLTVDRVIRVDAWDDEPAYGPLLAEARAATAARLLAAAEGTLEDARAGDRFAAREGATWLARRRAYVDTDDDYAGPLETELRDWGTVRVVARVVDRAGAGVERELETALVRRLRREWTAVYLDGAAPQGPVDAYVDLIVVGAADQFSNTTRSSQCYRQELERSEKVGVDTLGQPVYETRVEVVEATVVTSTTVESATARAELYVATTRGEVLDRREVHARSSSTYVRRKVEGDDRALAGASVALAEGSEAWPGALRRQAALNLGNCLPQVEVDGLLGERRLVAN